MEQIGGRVGRADVGRSIGTERSRVEIPRVFVVGKARVALCAAAVGGCVGGHAVIGICGRVCPAETTAVGEGGYGSAGRGVVIRAGRQVLVRGVGGAGVGVEMVVMVMGAAGCMVGLGGGGGCWMLDVECAKGGEVVRDGGGGRRAGVRDVDAAGRGRMG